MLAPESPQARPWASALSSCQGGGDQGPLFSPGALPPTHLPSKNSPPPKRGAVGRRRPCPRACFDVKPVGPSWVQGPGCPHGPCSRPQLGRCWEALQDPPCTPPSLWGREPGTEPGPGGGGGGDAGGKGGRRFAGSVATPGLWGEGSRQAERGPGTAPFTRLEPAPRRSEAGTLAPA